MLDFGFDLLNSAVVWLFLGYEIYFEIGGDCIISVTVCVWSLNRFTKPGEVASIPIRS